MHATHATADFTYDAYQLRQENAIQPGSITAQADRVRPSGHFAHTHNGWQPQHYKGFAVISMVSSNPGNEWLQQQLTTLQHQLLSRLHQPTAYFPLPVASFHQTIANTLSDQRFQQHLVQTGLLPQYPALVQQAFQHIPPATATAPIRLQLTGLSIFGTSIGLLGTFDNPHDYQRITSFRRHFYATPTLAALDVKMTRPFIGHVTIAYIEKELNATQKEHLATVINELNQQLHLQPLAFQITHTNLHYYNHLAEFQQVPEHPQFNL